MTIGQVMKAIPGITMPFLYYLEGKGYIKPHRVPKRRLARREYSDEDVALLRSAFALYREGYSPRAAFATAKNELARQAEPGVVASVQFSGPVHAQDLVHRHTGDGDSRVFTPIVPATQISAVVESAPDHPDRFVLHVSLIIGNTPRPYTVTFRRGSSVIRSVKVDDRGSGFVPDLSREEVDALKQHTRLDVALLGSDVSPPVSPADDIARAEAEGPEERNRIG